MSYNNNFGNRGGHGNRGGGGNRSNNNGGGQQYQKKPNRTNLAQSKFQSDAMGGDMFGTITLDFQVNPGDEVMLNYYANKATSGIPSVTLKPKEQAGNSSGGGGYGNNNQRRGGYGNRQPQQQQHQGNDFGNNGGGFDPSLNDEVPFD